MDGKRFGIGLAGGLLFGLAIITASGVLSSAQGSFVPLDFLRGNAAKSATTTTLTVAATVTASTTTGTATAQSTSTTAQVVLPIGSGNVTKSFGSNTTTTSTPSSVINSLNSGLTSSSSPGYSSRIASISEQPLLSNAVILIPVLVAFLLGAILHRASNRNKEEAREGQS